MNWTTQIAIAAHAMVLMSGGCSLNAQVRQNIYASGPFSPPAGKFTVQPHESEPVGSFDQLIKMSHLIVDGTVVSVMPTIIGNLDVPGYVETDSLISIREVIRGKPSNAGQILLIELGGKQGQWDVSVAGNPLVQQGERYILFLAPDFRKEVPNGAGVLPDASVATRYYAIGYANGKACISTTESVQFRPGAISELHKYDKTGLSSFVTTLKDRIGVLFPVPPPYPKGAIPIKLPSGTRPPGALFPIP